MSSLHPIMADVIRQHLRVEPTPLDTPPHRDDGQRGDVALMAATGMLRSQLRDATGDDLAVDVARHITRRVLATWLAAVEAGGTR